MDNTWAGASSTVNRDEISAFASQFDGTLPFNGRWHACQGPDFKRLTRPAVMAQGYLHPTATYANGQLQKSIVRPTTSRRAELARPLASPRRRTAVAATRCP